MPVLDNTRTTQLLNNLAENHSQLREGAQKLIDVLKTVEAASAEDQAKMDAVASVLEGMVTGTQGTEDLINDALNPGTPVPPIEIPPVDTTPVDNLPPAEGEPSGGGGEPSQPR
jgi:hypothetical protein